MHVSCLRIKVRNLLQVICMSYRSLIFELPYKSAYDKKIPHSFLQMTIILTWFRRFQTITRDVYHDKHVIPDYCL